LAPLPFINHPKIVTLSPDQSGRRVWPANKNALALCPWWGIAFCSTLPTLFCLLEGRSILTPQILVKPKLASSPPFSFSILNSKFPILACPQFHRRLSPSPLLLCLPALSQRPFCWESRLIPSRTTLYRQGNYHSLCPFLQV
jgi:hypothetical protein